MISKKKGGGTETTKITKTTTAAATTRSRTRVGKYELGRTIGEGSFAKVKIARNVDNGQSAAIKILVKNQIVKHPRMMEQLKKEISTMKMVQHPNVIKIYEKARN
ncbi:CBL-interacting protein kinase [Arachis hypogaea]|nr:CBL-interacting protein kinase [Arachis hypogaea]